jgi:hypothetical protein
MSNRLTDETLKDLKRQHEGWIYSAYTSKGQLLDSHAILALIKEIAILKTDLDLVRKTLLENDNANYAVYEERDKLLDSLTVTQEEWFLRTKSLEIKNYDLRQALESIVADFPDTRPGLTAKQALEKL